MPQDLYDSDGNKIEGVFTKEEHETQLQDASAKAIEEAKKAGNLVDKSSVDSMQTELAKAKEDLEKLGKKDYNFQQADEARKKAEETVKALQGRIDEELGKIRQQISGEQTSALIKNLSAGDVELEKKIKFHLERLSKSDDTSEQRQKNLEDAATLAIGKRPAPSVFNGIRAGGAYSPQDMKDSAVSGPVRPELVPLAHKLGLSDKDLDKFSNKK